MQQHFRLLIFLNQPYMFRASNSPILRRNFWLFVRLLVQCTDTAAGRCTLPKAVYTVKKLSWGWANSSPETCRADLKRLINEKVVASCWLLTSSNISLSECNRCTTQKFSFEVNSTIELKNVILQPTIPAQFLVETYPAICHYRRM